MKTEAIVFDFDGVCIDTEYARFVSWANLYKEHGEVLPKDEWIKNIGHASWVSDPFTILERRLGKKLDREQFRKKHVEAEKKIADGLPLQDGLVGLLEKAKKNGIACGIASSSSHRWVDGHLSFRGLSHFFTTVICRDDTDYHKPDPEPYLKALKHLGVKGENAVAIEDSPTGIAAANAAGMYTIAVPCSITKGMDFSAADLMVDTLLNVQLENVVF